MVGNAGGQAARYVARVQDHKYWCVWDTHTDAVAIIHDYRWINLSREKAIEVAAAMEHFTPQPEPPEVT
jgi:hypothetical protein